MSKITQSELKKILSYDKSTGLFVWIKSLNKKIQVGDIAGTVENGYITIQINNKKYKAHRLAWLYITGKYPQNHIDHKNHNRADNSIENLRDITQQNNNKNASKRNDNTSGVVGVAWKKSTKRWFAQIRVDEKVKHLGYFADFSDAVNARKNAEVLYGYYENHGK